MKPIKRIKRGVSKNAPTILTVTGVACFGVAIFTAIRETPKYEQLLDEEEDRLNYEKHGDEPYNADDKAIVPTKTKLVIAAKVYWPTAVIAGLGVASLVGANRISGKRQKALSAAYMGATEALQRYQKHLAEHLDENTLKKIEEKVAGDDISANPKTEKNTERDYIVTEDDPNPDVSNLYWIYDRIGNRYFKSSVERIEVACARANNLIMVDDYISFNELCDQEPLRLQWIPVGDMLEWNTAKDNYSEIGLSNLGPDYIKPKFIDGHMPDGTPCKEWTFENLPITVY